MFALFGKTLGAIAYATISIAAMSAPSTAGGPGPYSAPTGPSGGRYPGIGYHGRTAGGVSVNIPPVNVTGVNIFTGRNLSTSPAAPAIANVVVYGGGYGSYVTEAKGPEYIDGLEVVTVVRGAGSIDRTVDGVCVAPDGHEMPAARTRPAGAIDQAERAEILRCEAGLKLRAWVSAPGSSVANGVEVVCGGAMSLWTAPGGHVKCRPKGRMACTEAELRHANGAGTVVIAGRRQDDGADVIVTRGLSLNGGVGYAPY